MIQLLLGLLVFSVQADVAFKPNLKLFPPPPLAGCSITAQSQDLVTPFGVWTVQGVDIKADKILLWYSNPGYVPGSLTGFYTNFIFVWQRNSTLGPWVVYAGDESISFPKVSPNGHVAFLRHEPAQYQVPAIDELVVCSIDLSRGTTQFAPYPCASNPTNRRVVDTVVHNHNRNILGQPVQPNQPDGALQDWEWLFDGSQDILAFSRRQYSTSDVRLNVWSEVSGQLVGPAVDTVSSAPITTTATFSIVDSHLTTLAYMKMVGFSIEYKGAFSIGTGIFQNVLYHSEGVFGAHALSSNTFATVPTGQNNLDRHMGLFAPVISASLPASLTVKSSRDGFTLNHPGLSIPGSNGRKLTQLKHTILSSISSYIVAATSGGYPSNPANRVEIIQDNTPFSGTTSAESFTHYATVAPLAPYTNLDLVTASWDGILAHQHSGPNLDGGFVLIDCQ